MSYMSLVFPRARQVCDASVLALPAYRYHVRLCDENGEPVKDEAKCLEILIAACTALDTNPKSDHFSKMLGVDAYCLMRSSRTHCASCRDMPPKMFRINSIMPSGSEPFWPTTYVSYMIANNY